MYNLRLCISSVRENRGDFYYKNILKQKDMLFKPKSCHDCLFEQICDNPNKKSDGTYRCKGYEWKYQ